MRRRTGESRIRDSAALTALFVTLSVTPQAGSVRQFSERTSDGGKTWQVNYDLIYTKRSDASR